MAAGFLFALRSRKEASVHLDNSREASFWGDLTNGSSQQSHLSSRIIVLEYWTRFVQEPTSVAISAPVGRALERMARSHSSAYCTFFSALNYDRVGKKRHFLTLYEDVFTAV